MKIVIIGVHSQISIGYQIGRHLHEQSHQIWFASRNHLKSPLKIFGFVSYDTTNSKQVAEIKIIEPEVVIYAAGVFTKAQKIGAIEDWDAIKANILTKSYGVLATLDAAVRCETVRKIIFLGGREVSSLAGYASYTCGNGAMWALTQFSARHLPNLSSYFIDLPLVENSTMAKKYLDDPATEAARGGSITIEVVCSVVDDILNGKHHTGERIVLGENWTA